MTDIKGDRLYVELGASQVRRRLKHFGHGVRKVEAVGRKQAVIIHTATGEHLRELEAFLAGRDSSVNQRRSRRPEGSAAALDIRATGHSRQSQLPGSELI